MEDLGEVNDTGGNTPEMTFISMTKPGVQQRNKYLIRSHAMRFVRRRQKKETAAQRKDGQRSIAERLVPRQQTKPTRPKSSGTAHSVVVLEKNKAVTTVRQVRDPSPVRSLLLHNLGKRDHQLLSHISSLYAPLFEGVSEKFVIWTDGVRLFMGIAFAHNFVMQTLLAWSATHLSWATKNSGVMAEAYQYRAKAYKGLHNAIENFSAENSDAILVASIMMGWQATTTESWITMIRGTSVVKATIANHKYKSYFLEDNNNAVTSQRIQPPTNARENSPPISLGLILSSALQSLIMLDCFLGQTSKLLSPARELISIVQNMLSLLRYEDSEAIEDQIQRLKTVLFWTPTTFIDRINYDPTVMLFMAHLHAIALVAQPLADVGSAHFRGLNAAPIQAFYDELSINKGIVKQDQYATVMQLMEFPCDAITYFKDTLNQLMDNDCTYAFQDTNFSFQDTRISMLKVLTSCPVGLWHNSLETRCKDSDLW